MNDYFIIADAKLGYSHLALCYSDECIFQLGETRLVYFQAWIDHFTVDAMLQAIKYFSFARDL